MLLWVDRVEVIEGCDVESGRFEVLKDGFCVSRVCSEKLGMGTLIDTVILEAALEKLWANNLEAFFKIFLCRIDA